MRILTTLLILLPLSVLAEMYIWTNSAGNTEAWGVPPPWYRNPEWRGHAPHTQVYLNGHLLDDTTIQLDNEDAQMVRNIALRRAIEQRVRSVETYEEQQAAQEKEELQQERKAEAKQRVDRVMKGVPLLKGMKQRDR